MSHTELWNIIKQYETNKIYNALITYANGEKKEKRVFFQYGNAYIMLKRSRKKGVPVYADSVKNIQILPDVAKKQLTGCEQYIKHLKNWKKAVLTMSHANAWDNLKKDALSITDEKLAELARKAEGLSQFETWQIAGQIGLPQIEAYKTKSVTSVLKPKNRYGFVYAGFTTEKLKQHFDNKEEFRYKFTNGYDYTVSGGLGKDGIYRAWLSEEFRNCGNGHYYLLISEEKALFCEND